MTNDDLFDQKKQDLKDQEIVKANKTGKKKDIAEEAKKQSDEDRSIFNYFDIKFFDQPLENEFQLHINRRPSLPVTHTLEVFSVLYIRIREDHDEIVLPGISNPIKSTVSYINKLLDYHFNYCKADKKEFVYKLTQGIKDAASIYFDEKKEFESTTVGEEFERWVNRKLALVDQPGYTTMKSDPILFDDEKIKAIYDSFNGELWVRCDYQDFRKCFNAAVKPNVYPDFNAKKGNQRFIYILDAINDSFGKKPTDALIEKNFGIKDPARKRQQIKRQINKYPQDFLDKIAVIFSGNGKKRTVNVTVA